MTTRTTEQSDRTRQILSECHRMKEISQEFSSEGNEVQLSGRDLKSLSDRLDHTVEQFSI